MFLFNFYLQQKRAWKLYIFHKLMKIFIWICNVTNMWNDFFIFQHYSVVTDLFISLAKKYIIFWKYYVIIHRNNIFELTYYMIIIDAKRHSLELISVYFKKTKFTLLKSVYFHFKTPTKQMLVYNFAKILCNARARL